MSDATKLALIASYDTVLGLDLIGHAKALTEKNESAAGESDPRIEELLAARTAAKKAKNFAEADRIRDELKAEGVTIIDTPEGPKWSRS